MRALLDTHVFLWALLDSPKLSQRAREILVDARSTLLFSSVSSLEMAIKVRNGRLRLPAPLCRYLPNKFSELGLAPLPVEHSHAFRVAELPAHHRDPFDRLLIAQAQLEGVPLISADTQLHAYDVEVIW